MDRKVRKPLSIVLETRSDQATTSASSPNPLPRREYREEEHRQRDEVLSPIDLMFARLKMPL